MAGRGQPKVKWREKAGPASNARRELPRLVAAFFTDLRAALARKPRPENLHPLRVRAKHLRYSLELFRPCYGPGLEERIEALKKLQDVLGDVNDPVAARATIGDVMRPGRRRTAIERFATARAAEKAKLFHEHWKTVFDAPGRERWWTGYLAREAHAPEK